MSKFDVTVLITFFNQEEFVDRTLESVFSQETEYSFKVLVGDDGSTDNTLLKLEKWKIRYQDQLEVFINEEHDYSKPGVFNASKNRINLLRHVESEFFIFLDGDDYYCDQRKIQKQVRSLKNHEECVACGHPLIMEYPNGETVKMNSDSKLQEGVYSFRDYWKKIYCSTDSLMIRTEVIEKLPCELLSNQFDDELITFSVLTQGNIWYCNDYMVSYYQTGDGVWNSKNTTQNALLCCAMYDMCNIIEPRFKRITQMRLRGIWADLIKNRDLICGNVVMDFAEEAYVRNLKMTKLWVDYPKSSQLYRICVCIKSLFLAYRGKEIHYLNKVSELVNKGR